MFIPRSCPTCCRTRSAAWRAPTGKPRAWSESSAPNALFADRLSDGLPASLGVGSSGEIRRATRWRRQDVFDGAHDGGVKEFLGLVDFVASRHATGVVMRYVRVMLANGADDIEVTESGGNTTVM